MGRVYRNVMLAMRSLADYCPRGGGRGRRGGGGGGIDIRLADTVFFCLRVLRFCGGVQLCKILLKKRGFYVMCDR